MDQGDPFSGFERERINNWYEKEKNRLLLVADAAEAIMSGKEDEAQLFLRVLDNFDTTHTVGKTKEYQERALREAAVYGSQPKILENLLLREPQASRRQVWGLLDLADGLKETIIVDLLERYERKSWPNKTPSPSPVVK